MNTEDLGPLRLVKCVRCGKDKWRGPDPVCAVCRDHQEHPVGSGEGRTKQVNNVAVRLWGADLAKPIDPFPCDCGETVYVTFRREPWGWWLQHGENPEHTSPQWTEPFIHLPQDWVDSIHARGGRE